MISVMDKEGNVHNYDSAEEAVLDFDFKLLHEYPFKTDFFYHDIMVTNGWTYQAIATKGMVVYVPYALGEKNPPPCISLFIQGSEEV